MPHTNLGNLFEGYPFERWRNETDKMQQNKSERIVRWLRDRKDQLVCPNLRLGNVAHNIFSQQFVKFACKWL